MRPIIDIAKTQNYQGLDGGLYPDGTNTPPAQHDAEGRARAASIQPIGGKVVLMAIGLSNSKQEWCGVGSADSLPCNPWTFMGQSNASSAVDHDALVIVNGAAASQETETWDEVTDDNYARIAKTWLTPLGLTPSQVQVVQMLEMTGPVFDGTTPEPTTPRLPAANADAYQLVAQYGDIARTLKKVYPSLSMIFVSPRAYGGFGTGADGNSNPEPYAFETGFATKLFVEAQIRQCPTSACNGPVDPLAGDLSYASGAAPWITWGAYLWAEGAEPNSEGLFYVPADFQASGQHPTQAGETVIASKLLDFYLGSPYATPWFAGEGGGPSCSVDHTCLRSTDLRLRARGETEISASARVTVRSDSGLAIADATVAATWTLPDGSQESASAETNTQGIATLQTGGPAGTYTITITDIVKAGYTFDPIGSVLTDSVTRTGQPARPK
jgi:hypothetical protein